MDWINLSQDRNKWQVLAIEGNCWTSCGPGSFSGRTLLHGISQCPI